MIHNIYTVFDSAVEAYMQPYFARTHGEAIRSFEAACQDPSHPFTKNAKDYTMFHLGQMDDSTALFEMNMTPIPLAKAHEVLARQQQAA